MAVPCRLRGGKGQEYEGGVRMPGAAMWPGQIPAGVSTRTLVSTMDIFPTALALAGVQLPSTYAVDGHDMLPVLRDPTASTRWDVFLHYCGFRIIAARVAGRWKVFWAMQKWYTFDPPDASICTECCNGVNRAGRAVTHTNATELCGCGDHDLVSHEEEPIVFDVIEDPTETIPLTNATWPANASVTYQDVVTRARNRRREIEAELHPKPSIISGAGTCTEGLPSAKRQPCCPGCHAKGLLHIHCVSDVDDSTECTCNQD